MKLMLAVSSRLLSSYVCHYEAIASCSSCAWLHSWQMASYLGLPNLLQEVFTLQIALIRARTILASRSAPKVVKAIFSSVWGKTNIGNHTHAA